MHHARCLAVEVLLLASLVQSERSAHTGIHLPSVLLVDGVFGVDECRVFLLSVICRPVASEHNGRPAQQQRKSRLLEAVVERAVEEASRLVRLIVEVLAVVIRSARREVVCVHSAELEACASKRYVVVELLVVALCVGAAPKSECGVSCAERIAQVGEDEQKLFGITTKPQGTWLKPEWKS